MFHLVLTNYATHLALGAQSRMNADYSPPFIVKCISDYAYLLIVLIKFVIFKLKIN
jgi:hypothetical protein